MSSRGVLIALLLLGVTGCATARGEPGAVLDLQPGERPAADSDEAGLWMQMDRVEKSLKGSGQLVSDPALGAYLRVIVCALAPDHCPHIRVYVVQTPHFNATMAPNGVMQVWTGLLLRADNEAQLAYVLAHELAHYVRRHSVQRFRDIRTKSSIVAFFSAFATAAGQGYAGSLAQLIALGSIFAFSRDNEREADEIGLELLAAAGYDPRESARIWEALEQERRAGGDGTPLIFFSTHPSTDERIETLEALADRTYRPDRAWRTGRAELRAAILALRPVLLRDELRRRDFARSQALADRLLAAEPDAGLLHFFQGELFRLRNHEGDEVRAIASYERALAVGDAPPETSRALGLLLMRRGDAAAAGAALRRYLTDSPAAEDRQMIESYLERLR